MRDWLFTSKKQSFITFLNNVQSASLKQNVEELYSLLFDDWELTLFGISCQETMSYLVKFSYRIGQICGVLSLQGGFQWWILPERL